jgi:3-deoxy-7-phosphoheptulonate synthase
VRQPGVGDKSQGFGLFSYLSRIFYTGLLRSASRMIVVMEPDASPAAVERVIAFLTAAGFDVHRSSGHERTILGVVGDVTGNDVSVVSELACVAQVVRVSEPFRLASRRFRSRPTVIEGAWGIIGGDRPWIAIEPIGPSLARASADQPPPSELPYEVAAGGPFDAAVTRSHHAQDTIGALACLSIHAQPSRQPGPVRFVERSPSWGANTWIAEAERELARGEVSVVLLEAGGEYPNGARTLEIAAIARAKQRTHLPIVVDVPTIAQRARYCEAVACAAIAAGSDGVILRAWAGRDSDAPRVPSTLKWADAVALAEKLRAVGAAVRR